MKEKGKAKGGDGEDKVGRGSAKLDDNGNLLQIGDAGDESGAQAGVVLDHKKLSSMRHATHYLHVIPVKRPGK